MSAALHTPGPWVVMQTDDGHEIRMGEAVSSPWNHESHLLVEYSHGVQADEDIPEALAQYAEAEANARLIAAAPELLSALQKARDQVVAFALNTLPAAMAVKQVAYIDAALAKAGTAQATGPVSEVSQPTDASNASGRQ